MAGERPNAEGAFRTIGQLSADLGVPQHILRYWETRFTQLRPLQRAGNRRYYRPADVALAERIHRLLNSEGYTIRGVQQLLSQRAPAAGESEPKPVSIIAEPEPAPAGVAVSDLRAIRDRLARALAADA